VAPAGVIGIECATLIRAQIPDGKLTDLTNPARAKEAARRDGLIDRRGEWVESDDGRTWRRKESDDGVMAHTVRFKRPKPERVDLNRCFRCGCRIRYKPGASRFCGEVCREQFDQGAEPYAAEGDRIAA